MATPEAAGIAPVINYFTIALTHGLIALAAFRLLWRDDLDSDEQPEKRKPDGTRKADGQG